MIRTRHSRFGFAVGMLVSLLAWLGAPSTGAAEREKERLEARLAAAAVYFEALQADAGRAVPPQILREARGVVILRETKAGLIIGGKSGSGVALVKRGTGWSPPAFFRLREGGIGLQAGWQSATFVHVLMTDAAVAALRTNEFRFGVGLRVTSGPRTMGDEAKTSSLGADVLVYSDTGGLYGGLAVEGGVLRPDASANRGYYGRPAVDVLFGRESPVTGGAARFMELIERYSRAPGGG